jgi:hypothetical protein
MQTFITTLQRYPRENRCYTAYAKRNLGHEETAQHDKGAYDAHKVGRALFHGSSRVRKAFSRRERK